MNAGETALRAARSEACSHPGAALRARDESRIDAITLEVVRNKLEGIANEMQATLLFSAFSPIVKEAMDCSAALFTADGQTIAQATAIPIHLDGSPVPTGAVSVSAVTFRCPVDELVAAVPEIRAIVAGELGDAALTLAP